MKIIYNNIIPFKGFAAINLFGCLFVRNGVKIIDHLINHEFIHTEQQKELGYIGFFLLYIMEWLIRLIITPYNAYRNISFEQEAYNNENDEEYLKNRKKYSWLKYLIISTK